MQNPKFQIFKSTANGQFYFRLRSGNGEIILSSEGYITKQGCHNGIQAVKANAPYDSRYHRRKSVNGQYYFVLKASNGEIIGTSEMYTTEHARENGIQAVKRDAPHAPVEDLTLATV